MWSPEGPSSVCSKKCSKQPCTNCVFITVALITLSTLCKPETVLSEWPSYPNWVQPQFISLSTELSLRDNAHLWSINPKLGFQLYFKLKMASESFSWSIQRKDMLYWAVQSKLLRIKPDENTLQLLFDNEIAVIMNSKRLLHWASHLLCLWNVLVYLCSYSNAGLENQASCGLCTLLVQTFSYSCFLLASTVESCRMHFFTIICESPQAHLHSVELLRFMSDINHLSLPTPFYSVLASSFVFLSFQLYFISSILPTTLLFLTLFFRSISALLVLSTVYLY